MTPFPFGWLVGALVVIGLWFWPGPAVQAQVPMPIGLERDPNGRCLLECHGDPDFTEELAPGRYRSLYVDYEAFKGSVHARQRCVDCHTDVTVIPHPRRPKALSCLQCHYEGNLLGAPVEELPEKYKESAHGRAAKRGDPDAPTCRDCHTIHAVRSPADPASTVYRLNVPATCGACHIDVYTDYLESVHGLAIRGEVEQAAVCSDCHREHDIYPPDDPRSSLYPANVVNTCAKCHADGELMRQVGLPAEQVEAFKENFHGIALEFGVLKVANCTSCHRYHLVLAPQDPRSPVNPANLAATCGQCHPNATDNVAKGKFHILPGNPSAGVVYWVALFFKWLTILVLAGLLTHIALDLFGRLRRRLSRG